MSDSSDWLRDCVAVLPAIATARVLAIADELEAAQKTIQSLRADLDNPPGDVQEKVIQMLGMEAAQKELSDAVQTLEFYANPDTYFAIGFFPDPPCGEFMDDFSDVGDLGFKPGKRARELFDKYTALKP